MERLPASRFFSLSACSPPRHKFSHRPCCSDMCHPCWELGQRPDTGEQRGPGQSNSRGVDEQAQCYTLTMSSQPPSPPLQSIACCIALLNHYTTPYQPWEYRIEYQPKPEISKLFTVSKSIEYRTSNIEYRWYWKIVIYFVFFRRKGSILRPKTHIFESLIR